MKDIDLTPLAEALKIDFGHALDIEPARLDLVLSLKLVETGTPSVTLVATGRIDGVLLTPEQDEVCLSCMRALYERIGQLSENVARVTYGTQPNPSLS